MRYKSRETMEFIKETVEEFYFVNHRSPSITEIASEVRCARSTIHSYLKEMDSRGLLSYNGKTIETDAIQKAHSSTVFSPLLGSVSCGQPEYTEENFEEYIPLPVDIFGEGDFFILRASGYSMIEAGIDPGDLVVVRKQNTANEGDIIVALVDNETTLKRFYRDKKRKCIRLHPENSEMKDILVKNCYIQGVAQNVIKTLT